MYSCCVCQNDSVHTTLNFGKQPISNRFLFDRLADELTCSFEIGFCESCGLVQMLQPPTSDQLKPCHKWIQYNEPEGHLDNLVELIIQLPGVTQQSIFLGLSHFENSTLVRLENKGYLNVDRLNINEKHNQANVLNVIEVVLEYLDHKEIKKISQSNSQPNVIIARDILEHAHDPIKFMQGLRAIVKPDGYVVFEVPNYQKNFACLDYSSLWEEHISYFTPDTIIRTLEKGGFSIQKVKYYEYDLQDYIVVIAMPEKNKILFKKDECSLETEKNTIIQYSAAYPVLCLKYRQMLTEYRQHGKIVMFGAGHLASHFINLFKLADLIDMVIDDHPKKCGMFMPGSRLPICSSKSLNQNDISLCLLSLGQESEQKVIQNNADFVNRGGIFASIFPTSQIKLRPYQLVFSGAIH